MIAGVILKDTLQKKSKIAFLGDETECFEVETNDELVELLKKKKPEVVAFDVGTETSMEELTDKEQDLKDDGYAFTPSSHDVEKRKRLEALKAQLFQEMGAEQPEIIRFDPRITADELALHEDSGLESLGVDTSGIGSAEEFDAVLGAVTARFYEQNQHKDLGVIVPENLESEE